MNRPLLSKYCTVIMMYRSQGGAIIILCTHHNSLNSTSYAPKVELMLLSYVHNNAVQLWVKYPEQVSAEQYGAGFNDTPRWRDVPTKLR